MAVNQPYIQQQIVNSIKGNTSGDAEQAIQQFSLDLSKIITEAILSATITIPPGGVNPSNTTVVAGGFPGVATSIAPIIAEIL